MFILYVVIAVSCLIPILLTICHIKLISKKDISLLHIHQVDKSYISSRTRGSVRQGTGRIKAVEDYYELEKEIKFPKKFF